MIDIPGPTFSNAICVWCPLCKTLQKLFHQISTMEIRSRFTNANFVYGNLTSQREFMMPYLNSRSKFQYTMWKKNGTLLLSYVHSLPNQYFVKYNLHGSFLIFCKIVLFLLDFKVSVMLLQLLLNQKLLKRQVFTLRWLTCFASFNKWVDPHTYLFDARREDLAKWY